MAAFLIALAAAARQPGCGRREPEDAFDTPDDLFRRHFRLKEETVRWMCDEVAEELGGAIVHAGARNKWVHFPRTSEEKAAVKGGFLQRGAIPGVIGCVDGSLNASIAPKGEQKAAFMCRKGYYVLNTMLICDAGVRILTVDTLRPGSDHDAYVWRTTWLRRRFQEAHNAKAGEHLLDEQREKFIQLQFLQRHPPIHTAEGPYNTAHAATRSVLEWCIGLLKSRFRCLQRYHALHCELDCAANVVAACAVLHNLCLDEGDVSDVVSDDCSNCSSDDESDNPSPEREFSK
ncbi:putative nuclease HARBI1 [Dermacentor albipictus]|uniref:putative nuclease HARBI1 n=1 Tax=Dermacentor albipictus TaxID=60249 RepID=UPI0038FC2983